MVFSSWILPGGTATMRAQSALAGIDMDEVRDRVAVVPGTTAAHHLVVWSAISGMVSLLAVTARALLTVVIDEMVPEAHAESDGRLAVFALTAEIALLAALSAFADVE